MRLVCSGWRACSGGLGSVVLDRGGGESARAKGGGWESVVEDGEVVVGVGQRCAQEVANLAKSEDEAREDAFTRSRPGL